MLSVLGLDRIEEATYRYLVGQPSSDASGIAEALELDAGHVAQAISSLESRGLVSGSTMESNHFVAAPPSVALGSILLQRQQDLGQVERELHTLMALYRSAVAQRTVTDVLDVVIGPAAVAQRFAQLQAAARSEILALVRPQVAVVSAEENEEEGEALYRGIDYKVILERGGLEQPGLYERAMATAAFGQEQRVVEKVPMRMMIVDREFALLPLSSEQDSDGPTGALLVHPSGLLDALLALFDYLWSSASPLIRSEADHPHELDQVDQQVLTLLMVGLTDQSVGTNLGMSLRSVQRRVRSLMDTAGVSTRIQLGREAQRRGWLPD